MAYVEFKDLPKRTASGKATQHKVFNFAKNIKYDVYQRVLVAIVYRFFNKKNSVGAVESEIISNQELAKELHKRIIRQFEKRKVHSSWYTINKEI